MLQDLRGFCTQTKVSGEMTHLLVEGIYWFLYGSPLENIAQYPQHLHQLIYSQEATGWDQFFLGRLLSLWQELHQHHLVHQG